MTDDIVSTQSIAEIGRLSIECEHLKRKIIAWLNMHALNGRFVEATQAPDWVAYQDKLKELGEILSRVA